MDQADTRIFEPDGRAIPFIDEGTGPTLVLIPGRGEDVSYLGTLASCLIEEDFRVVRVGTRDEGSAAELAQDVVDIMDALDIADAWIGGQFSGGQVARDVSLAHADRVNGVLMLTADAPEGEPVLAPGVPVLILQGTEDDITPPENGERYRAAAPDRVVVTMIEGGGHLFSATHAGETAAVIEDYLDWD